MLYHILISTMVAVLAAGADEAPGKMKAELGEAVRGYGTPRAWDVNGRPADGNNTPTVQDIVDRYGFEVLPELRPFMEDPDGSIQSGVANALNHMVKKAETPNERKQLADEVLRWFCDPKCQEMKVLVHRADEIGSQYFSDKFKDDLYERLVASFEKPYGQERNIVALMAGVVGLKEALPVLGKVALKETDDIEAFVSTKRKWLGSLRWDALRARARMGVKEDIQLCIRVVKTTPDQGKLAGVSFEQLAYVRQPEIVEYLKPYAFRDDAAVETKGDMIGYLYCGVAIKALACMLDEFPLEAGHYPSLEDIEICREWLRDHPKYTLRR